MRALPGYRIDTNDRMGATMTYESDAAAARVAVLEVRLTKGRQMIDEARDRGQEPITWIEAWLELLKRYEQAYDLQEEGGGG